MKLFILLIFALAIGACGSGSEPNQDSSGSDKNENLDLSTDPTGGKAFIPSPGEIFTALNNLDQVEWSELAIYSTKSDYSTRYSKALNLGIRIADGFVAVNEENKTKCYSMNEVIDKLATDLGFGQYTRVFKDSLTIPIATGQWQKARVILDNLHFAVQDKVGLNGEKDIIALGAIGGWLEGLYVVSGHLKNNYNQDNSDLLNQGRLLKDYRDDLEELNINDPLVDEVEKGLGEIQNVIGLQDAEEITVNQVNQLYEISKNLINQIVNSK